MLSPHARTRERSLFLLSIEADRQRRAAGIQDPEPRLIPRRPLDSATMLQRLQVGIRETVQAMQFSGR